MKDLLQATVVDNEQHRLPTLHSAHAVSSLWKFVHISILACVLTVASWAVGTPVYAQWAELLSTYETTLGEGSAEIVAVRGNRGLLTNSADGSIDVLDLTNLGNINLIRRIKTPELTGVTSVAIHPYLDYFIAVAGSAKPSNTPQAGVASVFRLSDGALLTTFATGIQPDSIAIAPTGLHALIANEAEGFDEGDNGGNGSLTVVFLGYFFPNWPTTLHPIQMPLPSLVGGLGLSNGRKDDLARLLIDNTPATLEPEFVTFGPGGLVAYITLQENNAVLRLLLWNLQLGYVGLGTTTHEVDTAVDGQYAPNETRTLIREPDAIDTVNIDYRPYFVTADEGDSRDSAGNTGPRGGRTVSIFNALTGRVVADTGNQIDALAAAKGLYPDGRSNRGGAEPEGLDIFNTGSYAIAAVGLERADAVAFVNLTDPRNPHVFEMVEVGEGPEGVKLVRRTNTLYALVSSEGEGTLSVVRLLGVPGEAVTSAGVDQAAADSDEGAGESAEVVESAEESDWSTLETGFRNNIYLPTIVSQ